MPFDDRVIYVTWPEKLLGRQAQALFRIGPIKLPHLSYPGLAVLLPVAWMRSGADGAKATLTAALDKLCAVPGCRVDRVTQLRPHAVDVIAHATRGESRCPGCRHVSRAVHGRYVRRPADLPASGRTVVLDLHVRRFYCRNTACPKRTFAERFPYLDFGHSGRAWRRCRARHGRGGGAGER